MPLLIPLAIVLSLVLLIFLFINYRMVMSILAGAAFSCALTMLPPLIAGPDIGIQVAVFAGIVLVVYMACGKEIFKSIALNLMMGFALIFALIYNLATWARMG